LQSEVHEMYTGVTIWTIEQVLLNREHTKPHLSLKVF